MFYEQYLTIVPEGLFIIALCLLPTFVVCCLLLGLDLRSGLLNLLTIVMITVDTVGVMTLWGIDYNAVALINLVTVRTCRDTHPLRGAPGGGQKESLSPAPLLQAVGISVEFVSHMTRSFALSVRPTHVERAEEATARMGSAVRARGATPLGGVTV